MTKLKFGFFLQLLSYLHPKIKPSSNNNTKYLFLIRLFYLSQKNFYKFLFFNRSRELSKNLLILKIQNLKWYRYEYLNCQFFCCLKTNFLTQYFWCHFNPLLTQKYYPQSIKTFYWFSFNIYRTVLHFIHFDPIFHHLL